MSTVEGITRLGSVKCILRICELFPRWKIYERFCPFREEGDPMRFRKKRKHWETVYVYQHFGIAQCFYYAIYTFVSDLFSKLYKFTAYWRRFSFFLFGNFGFLRIRTSVQHASVRVDILSLFQRVQYGSLFRTWALIYWIKFKSGKSIQKCRLKST